MTNISTRPDAMAVGPSIPRGQVTASLNFFGPPADASERPFNNVDPVAGQPDRNYSDVVEQVPINDVRGREADFTLDKDAFAILLSQPPSAEKQFVDDESIKANYYPEVEKLLLEQIKGSEKVYIFDHTIRRADPTSPRNPVQRVHVDQTASSVEKRVKRYYSPEEAERLLQGRYRIVNVWRPLNETPVESFPLAFASSSTLAEEDVVPIEHRYPDGYRGETAAIRHSPNQKWYYLSGMTGDERVLLECFDSESLKPGSKIGGRVPHSAFIDPRTREGAEARASIEIRALVFGP